MLELSLSVKNLEGNILAQSTNSGFVNLVYNADYIEGDKIVLGVNQPNTYLIIQLDDVMNPSFVYMKNTEFTLEIPFEQKRVSYNPKTFTGNIHLLKAREATESEIKSYKNLAQNEYDCHGNTDCFPHAYANVETRGEAVFAARNAINGNTANSSHGPWPYESWGINRNPDAEMTVDFGRTVEIDKIILCTRADFPHDNYWKQAELQFSDGTTLAITMEKSDQPHEFVISPKKITWVKICKLIKDENDPSPFPALTQIEVYGVEIA